MGLAELGVQARDAGDGRSGPRYLLGCSQSAGKVLVLSWGLCEGGQ